jgi:hypothetical protein
VANDYESIPVHRIQVQANTGVQVQAQIQVKKAQVKKKQNARKENKYLNTTTSN